jgi:uncharacterized protein
MTVFIDTSAMYAFLDRRDGNHRAAVDAWTERFGAETSLVTSNYVMVELTALVQRRLGPTAVRDILEYFTPLLHVYWIDQRTHDLAMRTILAAGQRGISLVDAVSFEIMRANAIPAVFTFDRHFEDEGFERLP